MVSDEPIPFPPPIEQVQSGHQDTTWSWEVPVWWVLGQRGQHFVGKAPITVLPKLGNSGEDGKKLWVMSGVSEQAKLEA